MELKDRITAIRGVGEKRAGDFLRLGIRTVEDLLFYFPRSYEQYEPPVSIREAKYRDFAAVQGLIIQKPVTRYVKNLKITDVIVRDEEGSSLKITWFNMPYLSKSLYPGSQYVFRGQLKGFGSIRQMDQPQIFKPQDYTKLLNTLRPVYPLTKGITGKSIESAVRTCFDDGITVSETLPDEILNDCRLEGLNDAVREIHFPGDKENLAKARRRLVFEEFYRFILGVRNLRETVRSEPNHFKIEEKEAVNAFIQNLPYTLTNAQQKVIKEITEDMTGSMLMNRLVQGDVGSGKTIVAFTAMYLTALNACQSVMMAPTEVLAQQHYKTFTSLIESQDLNLSVCLLTGSMKASEKKEVYEKIRTHACDLIIGTHALIQEKVVYDKLALVITDEQHRFGVNQRKALKEKGDMPHVLVMSATPIPRTLGMILYGDMDISVMDEKPKNRLPIKNALVGIDYREKAWKFIQNQVLTGRQAYVICPMVEESEASEGENVTDYARMLDDRYPESIHVGVLHGRMKNEEKEAVMQAFSDNQIQVLVSTTVVEVGVDVPNATVMMIENAERFGLAQLHQLRGRIGRGAEQSYCIFIDTTMSEESQQRLKVVTNSNDGFFIASEDLRLRGPGDFFGIRQSGDVTFRLADIYTDAAILQQAEEAAEKYDIKDDAVTETAVL